MPEATPGRDAGPEGQGSFNGARGFFVALPRRAEEALSSDRGLAALCAGLVCLLAIAGFVFSRCR